MSATEPAGNEGAKAGSLVLCLTPSVLLGKTVVRSHTPVLERIFVHDLLVRL